jgi:hypothetical protein
MLKIKDRLRLFLKHLEMGQNRFAATVGISGGYITSKSAMTTDALMKIKAKYPELNLEWLITGIGNMLIIKQQDAFISQVGKTNVNAGGDIQLGNDSNDTVYSEKNGIVNVSKSSNECENQNFGNHK